MTVSQPPHIAVVTNISPNHLDIHADMDEYIDAKCRIFRGQSADDIAVFNADNTITADLSATGPGQTRLFSRRMAQKDGVWLENGQIFVNGEAVLAQRDILLPGVHNVENYMAAIAAVWGLASAESIRTVAKAFPGVEHRLELTRTLSGVRWYNDSIGTSPARTMAGLACFDGPLTLIAGGYDKHLPFDALGAAIVERAQRVILTGATADKIEQAIHAAPDYAPGRPEIIRAADLAEAVRLAHATAERGDVVLFSPACASFDAYPNFSVRGAHFKTLVAALA
jgi:UDP-N-acetylmuramoylalanine--D-glutamate ligase